MLILFGSQTGTFTDIVTVMAQEPLLALPRLLEISHVLEVSM